MWQLSRTICTSLCSSRDSVKNLASAANGSGTSVASASRLNVGHCDRGGTVRARAGPQNLSEAVGSSAQDQPSTPASCRAGGRALGSTHPDASGAGTTAPQHPRDPRGAFKSPAPGLLPGLAARSRCPPNPNVFPSPQGHPPQPRAASSTLLLDARRTWWATRQLYPHLQPREPGTHGRYGCEPCTLAPVPRRMHNERWSKFKRELAGHASLRGARDSGGTSP